jgi:hypothetical protein
MMYAAFDANRAYDLVYSAISRLLKTFLLVVTGIVLPHLKFFPFQSGRGTGWLEGRQVNCSEYGSLEYNEMPGGARS